MELLSKFNFLKNINTNYTIEVLQFHSFNSSTNSKLEQSLKAVIKNILNQKTNSLHYNQNMLYGHAPGQTQMTNDTTFQKIINKSILDLSQFNELKTNKKIIIAPSTGAYLVLNWLQQNPKNKIDTIILFKPLIDIDYTFKIFSQVNPELVTQIKFDEFKLLNKLYGTLQNKFNLNKKNKIIICCGDKDKVTGNTIFIQKRFSSEINILDLKNSEHGKQTPKEYQEFENYVKLNLNL